MGKVSCGRDAAKGVDEANGGERIADVHPAIRGVGDVLVCERREESGPYEVVGQEV